MINHLLTSFFFHVGVLLALLYTMPVPMSTGEKIEVNIRESSKQHFQAPILPSGRKSLIRGEGAGTHKKTPEVDMTEYANQLKAVVDPVWVGKIRPLNLPSNVFLLTEVLLFPDKYGNIIKVKVIKSSGSRDFDKLALDALREVKQIPKPPESLVKEGIIWSFSSGE